MLVACGLAIFEPFFSTGGGGKVFGYLHLTLFCATWVLVPLLTADCLSRERREGTLPLLFLTSLKPRGIVLAKALAHGLRALSLWMAVLPTMFIPFLLGGVHWQEAVLSLAVNSSAMLLALAAGILASSFCRTWRAAIATALVLAAIFAGIFIVANGLAVLGALFRYIPVRGRATIWDSPGRFLITDSVLTTNFDGTWSQGLSWLPPAAGRLWMAAGFAMALVSLAAAWLVIWIAGWRLKRTWRDEPQSARAERIDKALHSPVLGAGLLRRWLSWRLARNPIGWLEQRRPGGRLVAWLWFAALLFVYGAYGCNGIGQGFHPESLSAIQERLGWLLLLSIALSSAGSFRRERENGVLELLLVSPMREWEMIRGRLRALWSQFLPAIVIFLTASLLQAVIFRSEEGPVLLPYFALGYITLPVIGLYFSLARKHFIASVFWTLLFGGIFPVMLLNFGDILELAWGFSRTQGYQGEHPIGVFVFAFLLQAGLATVFALILRNHLARRKFALELA
jgi:ABC-type transport system involved in multi-copper enzyme maturation permease subunit